MVSKTIQQLALDALEVQDACNLSGVVHGWSVAMRDLCELLRNDLGITFCTDAVNRHPVNKLWASKVHDLTGMGLSDMDAFSKAYDDCKKLAEVTSEQTTQVHEA